MNFLKWKKVISAIIVVLCFISCSKDIIDTTGNIVGTVRDARSNEALRGATVTIAETGATITTGADGTYTFRNLESQNYTINVTKTDYKSDSKTVFVQPGKDNTVDFSLNSSVSVLSLSNTTLDFGTAITSLAFDIKNTGTAPLTWSISEDIEWLSCSPTSGTTQPESTSSVIVNVKRTGIEQGKYTQTIAVVSNGGSEVIRVDMSVENTSVSVSPAELDFGSTATSLQLTLTNNSNGNVSYFINASKDWIKLSKNSGSFASKENINVTVNRSGFTEGDYSGIITLTIGNDDTIIPVQMNVPKKEKPSVSPDELDFGSTTTSLQLTITNHSEDKVSYSISASNEWIKLSKNSGTFTSKENINVSVDRTGRSEGDYSGQITLTIDSEDMNIPVKMNIPNKEKPIVVIYSVEDETYNSATFKGGVVSTGSSKVSKHGFCWSKESEPLLDNSQVSNFGDCSEAKEITYQAKSLDSSTTYYVRAYAENAVGIVYSNILKFTTLAMPELPTVETGTVSNTTSSQAQVSGNIINIGNVTEITQHGHVWSETSNPTTSSDKTELGKTTKIGAFNSALTGLNPNTKYYVRAYATNYLGTAYGAEVSFTTNYGDIVLVTESAKDVTYKSALILCKITSLGGHSIAERGVCWGTAQNPTVANNIVKSTTNASNYEIALTNLEAETKYYVRAYVKAEDGTVFYGNEIDFTTSGKDVSIDKDGYGEDENWNSRGNGTLNKNGYDVDDDNCNK